MQKKYLLRIRNQTSVSPEGFCMTSVGKHLRDEILNEWKNFDPNITISSDRIFYQDDDSKWIREKSILGFVSENHALEFVKKFFRETTPARKKLVSLNTNRDCDLSIYLSEYQILDEKLVFKGK